jgi:hypothetical protein
MTGGQRNMHGAIGKTSEDEMLLEEKSWLHQQTDSQSGKKN